MVGGRWKNPDLWAARGVVLELNWDMGSLTLVGAFRSHTLASMPNLHNLPPPHPHPSKASLIQYNEETAIITVEQ